MGWLKVVFVVMMISRLDSIQQEINEMDNQHTRTDNLETTTRTTILTPPCETIASGCLNGTHLLLNFKCLKAGTVTAIKARETDLSCYHFIKMHTSFIAEINETLSNNCAYDLLSQSGTSLYYVKGVQLSRITSPCPKEEIIRISETIEEMPPETCSLPNFSVSHVYNEDQKFINLKVSWDKVNIDDNVGILIRDKTNTSMNCRSEMDVWNHSLLDNTILKPNMTTEDEVYPGCTYEVILRSAGHTKQPIYCTLTYTIPEPIEQKNPETCSLSNFSVGGVYSEDLKYINLKVSWDKINTDDSVDILIRDKSNTSLNCYTDLNVWNHSLLDNTILQPNMTTEDEVYPGCTYEVILRSTGHTKQPIYCTLTYTIPELSSSKNPETCSLSNFSVSWDKVNNNDRVNVLIREKNNSIINCYSEMDVWNHSLLNNSIIQPDYVTEDEVYPGCTYEISLQSLDQTKEPIYCTLTYTVPKCAKCTTLRKDECYHFEQVPKILDVIHISGSRFLVKWDPGKMFLDGKPYTNTEAVFKFGIHSTESLEPAEFVRNDTQEHTAEIVMKLLDGKKYVLIGSFANNGSCPVQSQLYEFTAPTKNDYLVIIVISIVSLLVAILLILKCKKLWKFTNKLLGFMIQDRSCEPPHELFQIDTEEIPMITNIQYIPVAIAEGMFDEYEFPRNKIIIKEAIGSGAFGQVYSAKAIGIGGIQGYRMVAVKTLGESESVTREAANDFIAEIEIFKKIGYHSNVVTLLGCCTVDTPYMMVMELVPCGDLKRYLVELRAQWLQRKNIAMGRQLFFPEDGASLAPPSPITPISIRSNRLPSTSENAFTMFDDPMTPLLAHFTLDKVLDHTELQNFAFQISRGMAHLEKISVTHRDLAARNILISEHKILKISDFGLSRSGAYINHRTKKLPLRWMAIEAIVEQKYDSKSDVWSFGVVLWEIGTLGAFPYESVPDSFLQQFLQLGRRLERPEICTDDVYSLMQKCWAADPENRPTFQELVEALDVKKRKIYVDFNQLNPTYIFPPSDIERVENPVRVINLDSSSK